MDQVQGVQRLFVANTSLLNNRAEDVLQEVFLTLTQKAAEFQPGTDFVAWARAIARIKVLQRYRSRPGRRRSGNTGNPDH